MGWIWEHASEQTILQKYFAKTIQETLSCKNYFEYWLDLGTLGSANYSAKNYLAKTIQETLFCKNYFEHGLDLGTLGSANYSAKHILHKLSKKHYFEHGLDLGTLGCAMQCYHICQRLASGHRDAKNKNKFFKKAYFDKVI